VGRSDPTREAIIESLVSLQASDLHPAHADRFESIRVAPGRVPVTVSNNEYVYVVAEHQGRVLYYSELEEAWGLAALDAAGCAPVSGRFQLKHIMNQLFGPPGIRTCGRGGENAWNKTTE
jgi:hypothetical protein